jgi:hypothetical protein
VPKLVGHNARTEALIVQERRHRLSVGMGHHPLERRALADLAEVPLDVVPVPEAARRVRKLWDQGRFVVDPSFGLTCPAQLVTAVPPLQLRAVDSSRSRTKVAARARSHPTVAEPGAGKPKRTSSGTADSSKYSSIKSA